MEESEKGSIRAEFACDSDEERREAHDEEVAERWLAREAGELDEGQDDSDEEGTIRKDIEFYGQCTYCDRIFYIGVKGHWMVRPVPGSELGLEKRTCCDQCYKSTDWTGFTEYTREEAASLPESKFRPDTDDEQHSDDEEIGEGAGDEEEPWPTNYDEMVHMMKRQAMKDEAAVRNAGRSQEELEKMFPGMRPYTMEELQRIAKAHGLSTGGEGKAVELVAASRPVGMQFLTAPKFYSLSEIVQAYGSVTRSDAGAGMTHPKAFLTINDPRSLRERHFTVLGEISSKDGLILENIGFNRLYVSLGPNEICEAVATEKGFSTAKIRPDVDVAPLDRSLVDEVKRDLKQEEIDREMADHSPLPTFDFTELYPSAMKKAIADGTFKLKQGIADGTIAVAKQEEVQSDEEEKTIPKFTYTKSLYDHKGDAIDYDDTNACIKTITFDISRYGKHKKTLSFMEPATEQEAIEAVEEFLSQPITEDYFNLVRKDLFDSDLKWPDVLKHYENRGALLTDCRFLESIDVDNKGNASIWCGS